MNYLIVFLLTITLYFTLNEARGCPKNMIQFDNQIGKGVTLKVSCESKDDKLADHYVAYKDFPFTIEFHEAAFGRTRWHCTMQHGKFKKYFRAWNQGFGARCNEIRKYIARSDAIYIEKNYDPEEFKYAWDRLP